jgi:hypothetical protein
MMLCPSLSHDERAPNFFTSDACRLYRLSRKTDAFKAVAMVTHTM